MTTIEGIVKNGQIVLPEGAILPEAAKVYVQFADEMQRRPRVRSPRLKNRSDAKLFEKVVEDIPDDEV